MYGVVHHPTIFSTILVFIVSLATSQQTDTLNELGTLYPFTPPADCSSFSVRTSGFIQFGDTQTLHSTIFQQGCHAFSRTSCCPRNFGIRGFYSPASGCPPGYTKHEKITFSGRRYIGFTYELSEKQGDVCCPSVVDPVTKYEFTPGFFSCDASVIKRISGQETFESWYGASAVVVVTEAGLPEPTPAETSAATSTSSSSAAVRTGSDREIPSETSSVSSSTSSPTSSSASNSPSETRPTSPDSTPPSESLRSGDADNSSQVMSSGDNKGLSTGAKVGIAVGVTIPVLIGIIVAVYMFGRRRGKALAPRGIEDPKYGGESKDMGVGGIQTESKI